MARMTVPIDIFILPSLALVFLLAGIFGVPYMLPLAILLGLGKIVVDGYENIRAGRLSLDYIACLAMAVSLYSGEYMAGAVIALMFTGGEALEAFASTRAYTALKALADTIPKDCVVHKRDKYINVPIQEVKEKEVIVVKRNEIVPLDGVIKSPAMSVFNLANLTAFSSISNPHILVGSFTFLATESKN
jgi:cation transport ATPase